MTPLSHSRVPVARWVTPETYAAFGGGQGLRRTSFHFALVLGTCHPGPQRCLAQIQVLSDLAYAAPASLAQPHRVRLELGCEDSSFPLRHGSLLAHSGAFRGVHQTGSTPELAEAADLHEQFVSQLERGARSATLETIDAVAAAVGVAPWELLRAGTDEQPPASSARRVQQLVEAWPERDQDRLVRLLIELRGLAASAAPARKRKNSKRD